MAANWAASPSCTTSAKGSLTGGKGSAGRRAPAAWRRHAPMTAAAAECSAIRALRAGRRDAAARKRMIAQASSDSQSALACVPARGKHVAKAVLT